MKFKYKNSIVRTKNDMELGVLYRCTPHTGRHSGYTYDLCFKHPSTKELIFLSDKGRIWEYHATYLDGFVTKHDLQIFEEVPFDSNRTIHDVFRSGLKI